MEKIIVILKIMSSLTTKKLVIEKVVNVSKIIGLCLILL